MGHGVGRVSRRHRRYPNAAPPTRSLAILVLATIAVMVSAEAARPSAAQAGGGCHMDVGAGYTEGVATVVRMDVCSFERTVIRVPVGTTVRFLNTAPNDHVVAGRRNTWGSEATMTPGAEFATAFRDAGVYPYSCPLHPGMVGAVIDCAGRTRRPRLRPSRRSPRRRSTVTSLRWPRPRTRRRSWQTTARRAPCRVDRRVVRTRTSSRRITVGLVVTIDGQGRHRRALARRRVHGPPARLASAPQPLGYTPRATIQSAYSLCSPPVTTTVRGAPCHRPRRVSPAIVPFRTSSPSCPARRPARTSRSMRNGPLRACPAPTRSSRSAATA